jgi:putative redox protein
MVGYDLEAVVEWVGGRSFLGYAREHSIIVDQPIDSGGRNIGFKPRELLLIALGGCLGTRIVSLIEEAGIKVKNLKINTKYLELNQNIVVNITIRGDFNEDEKKILKKVFQEAERLCAVTRMLRSETPVTIHTKIS